jgi:transcriptional regulator with XRE-family HTH domain
MTEHRVTYQSLREFLDATGLTQAQFALRVGLSQSDVSKILNGHRVPKLAVAIRIAEVAEIPIASLVPLADEAGDSA